MLASTKVIPIPRYLRKRSKCSNNSYFTISWAYVWTHFLERGLFFCSKNVLHPKIFREENSEKYFFFEKRFSVSKWTFPFHSSFTCPSPIPSVNSTATSIERRAAGRVFSNHRHLNPGIRKTTNLLRVAKRPSFLPIQKMLLFGQFAFRWVETVNYTRVSSFHLSSFHLRHAATWRKTHRKW